MKTRMKFKLITLIGLAATLVTTNICYGQSNGPKIYISADMEGLAEVINSEYLGSSGAEYMVARRILTEEVVAAIEGARAAGAGQIVVSDSHGSAMNLLLDRLPDDIEVVRGWPRPLIMMEGIDDTFDGVIFIGYHAGTTNPDGVRAHTMSSSNLTGVHINGVAMNEAGFNAAIAGHFNVPVIMVSGDDATIMETRDLIGDFEAVITKEAISYHAAQLKSRAVVLDLTRKAAGRAVSRIREFRPFKPDTPVTMEVSFKNYRPVQLLGYLPVFTLKDSHTISYTAKDMTEASSVLEFITSYQIGITP